jgi:hypothetical protein
MRGARWWRRLAGAVVAFAASWILLDLLGADPDPVRLAVLVGACIAVLGLMLDAFSDAGSSWSVEVERPLLGETGDPRLAGYVAVLKAHESARAGDHGLQNRLASLADRVLAEKHGTSRDDPGVADLLGPELAAVLNGPPRRLSRDEIDRCLTRIEEL